MQRFADLFPRPNGVASRPLILCGLAAGNGVALRCPPSSPPPKSPCATANARSSTRATLAIDEGDRIGLVGRNGCGKTTFLRILAGLQAPDSGEVTRRRDLVVSYLPQDFMLDAAQVGDGKHPRRRAARARSDRRVRIAAARLEAPRGTGASHPGARRLDARPAHRDGDVAPELSRRRPAHGHAVRRREAARGDVPRHRVAAGPV